ncbi:unnamed protein product [Microthlaspi erraticum]|uniref:NAC domain-containing protein n=1 Tax=Microthlaspi erraticum TaxID=1685480 RepID=A0A6D2JT56_9BRAS|nr:unnamed protein product [Microthlaspi erraticum]
MSQLRPQARRETRVKFDPTDQELIEHLEAKVLVKDIKSHPLIDEFIPTIEGEDGICYTHPEKLPGVTRDGLSRHFFHRPSKAYTTGTRKRRKIQTECDNNMQGSSSSGETRWHKTGKTRPVMVSGKQKGCKKILVLYTNFGKNRKPEKTNWVMHQYHLGTHEEEKEGELVVSKIFYQTQPRQCNWSSSTSSLNAIGGEGSSGGGGGEYHMRRDSGTTSGGSCSSSREILTVNPPNRSDEVGGVMAVAAAAVAAGLPNAIFWGPNDILRLELFWSFTKSGWWQHTASRSSSYAFWKFQIEIQKKINKKRGATRGLPGRSPILVLLSPKHA